MTAAAARWIYYFKNNEVKDEFKVQGLAEVKAQLQLDELSEQEQQAYEKYEKMLLSERGGISTARIEGKAEGEQQARIEMAQKMKAKDFAPETISEMTGLPMEVINDL